MNNYSYKGITWLETFAPTPQELDSVSEEYGINPYIQQDILSPTPYVYANRYEDSLYAVFHFPVFRMGRPGEKYQELDLVIKDKFLMTVRYDALEPLEVLAKKIYTDEKSSIHNERNMPAPILANIIIREMYLGVLDDLASFSDWLHDIEERIYQGKEKEMVTEISLASREMMEFRSSIHEHARELAIMAEIGSELFGDDFAESFSDVERIFGQLQSQTQFLTELVVELRETNNSLVTTKQNEIMKVLTILAFVTFPLSLIAGIFGMNVVDMPIVGQENDFWVIVGAMTFGMFLMFIFFRYKKWI